jgi:hypothetical protein
MSSGRNRATRPSCEQMKRWFLIRLALLALLLVALAGALVQLAKGRRPILVTRLAPSA